ncbi:MAG: hypothetical protein O3A21_00710 [Proteobacteria bacterium]|nr:hypothetical protein [Pseudomonadota bacterium]
MKLFFSGRDYIHKVLVVAAEVGVLDQITFVTENPLDDDAEIWAHNPLGRHPIIELDDGTVLNHGLLCCEYLASLGPANQLFPDNESRWRALSNMILGDGLFDATSALVTQSLRPESARNHPDMLRHRQRIQHLLPAMEREATQFRADRFDIGQVCFAGGVDYFDRRKPLRRVMLAPEDAEFEWRASCPGLSAWFDKIIERPSLKLRPSDLGIASQGMPKTKGSK